MARLDPFAITAERIEGTLRYLRREWSSVPEYVKAWEGWSEDEKLSFVLEAGIREDYLAQACEWARRGLLSTDQLKELRKIESIACANRSLLEPLLAED